MPYPHTCFHRLAWARRQRLWMFNVLCSRSGSSFPAVSRTHYTHHSKKVVQSGGAKSAQAGGGCTGARPNARKAGAPRQQLDDDEGRRTARCCRGVKVKRRGERGGNVQHSRGTQEPLYMRQTILIYSSRASRAMVILPREWRRRRRIACEHVGVRSIKSLRRGSQCPRHEQPTILQVYGSLC
jgi:hypothetical protein